MPNKTEATALIIARYCNLNTVGNGDVVAENKGIAVYNWAHSTVNIYGGTYLETLFGFNAHNTSCTDVVITLYEGVKFYDYQNHFVADYNGGRIALEEGCTYTSTKMLVEKS